MRCTHFLQGWSRCYGVKDQITDTQKFVGFLAGLVVSVFSKTLVLLTGLAIVTVQVSCALLFRYMCASVLRCGPLVTESRRWLRDGASTCSPCSRSASA